MDTRKMTLFATIAAIALLAVGIGYAYTASTSNTGNTINPEYVTIVQGGAGAYQFANGIGMQWDSDDKKVGQVYQTEFTLSNTIAGTGDADGFTLYKLGSEFTLKTAEEGMANPAALICAIASSGTWATYQGTNATSTFFLEVVNGQTTTWMKFNGTDGFNTKTQQGWSGDAEFTIAYANSAYVDTTITVYYAFDAGEDDGIVVSHAVGVAPEGPSTQPLNGAGLKFTVEI